MKKPILLIPFVLVSLILGLYSGLIRMGWEFPLVKGFGEHGAIMVGSFLGTLIIIERVVTMNNRWILFIPLVNAHSIVFFHLDYYKTSYILLIIGAAGLSAIMLYYTIKFKEYHNYILLAGALCLLAGNVILLLTVKYALSVTWWFAFFLLTIVAERLELTRYLPVSNQKKIALIVLLGIFVLGIIFPFQEYGKYISAASLVSIAGWLMMYDIAVKSVKKDGMFRYTALLLLVGYLWLIATAVFFTVNSSSNLIYDALLHSFFVGFVFSMIFAHAPIIIPGILKFNVKPYHPALYIWFTVLQLSLILRIAGDVAEQAGIRKLGGFLNGISILCFFINLIAVILIRRRKSASVLV
ncbi:MAG: hypothetical protein HY959_02080 [Ignavibacteriae bacterium]|nr:hypothetical protein [Ignavibacteriota bacterium]